MDVISQNKEIFSRNDIVRGLSKYIDDSTELYIAIENTLKSGALIELPANAAKRYTTKELIDIKRQLRSEGLAMARPRHSTIADEIINAAIKSQNKKLRQAVGASLSEEQVASIQHVLGASQLTLVSGYAGAGKSTMLAAANQAWQANNLNVIGTALSGKAADGLEKSSGIQSRTTASLEKSWEGGYNLLTPRDVLVIDEAGMVDLRQMARIVTEVKKRGAKLVLFGDAEQLQPIQAGTPFKELKELIGGATLSEVRRQTKSWQQDASKQFAEKKTTDALQLYEDHGCIRTSSTHEEAISNLVEDYMRDVNQRGVKGSRLALAHRRKDVHLINQSIRTAYQHAGYLSHSLKVKTDHGPREFSEGDRIVLTRNDRELGLRNGMLGRIKSMEGHKLLILIDGESADTRKINLDLKSYASIDHGYAIIIHKSQGQTVDKSFVLGSKSMDRHLSYVAMTRHRYDGKMYLDSQIKRATPKNNKVSHKRIRGFN